MHAVAIEPQPTGTEPESIDGESAGLDFKASFDSKNEWCELIKDIVAMANSGGGRILVGVSDDGVPSGFDVSPLLAIDLADVINKIRGFTDVNFSALKMRAVVYGESQVAEISIGSAGTPLVFGKSGNYMDVNGKQQCAFRQGALYVRHGLKSEPATSEDLRSLIEGRLDEQRKALFSNLRQVMEAPANAVITVAAPAAQTPRPVMAASLENSSLTVRIVDDKTAQEAIVLDVNSTHPLRQKDVVAAINQHFSGAVRFTTHDNIAIRKLHGIDAQAKFWYRPRFGSGQYSQAYVSWIIESISSDAAFLSNIRSRYHDLVITNNERRRSSTTSGGS